MTVVTAAWVSGLPVATIESVAALTEKIRLGQAREAAAIIEIGAALLEAKALLPHGAWRGWLDAEFSFTQRTAENYMRVADTFAEESKRVANLPAAVLYRLAAPSAPASVVEQVKSGALSRPEEITTRLDEWKVARAGGSNPRVPDNVERRLVATQQHNRRLLDAAVQAGQDSAVAEAGEIIAYGLSGADLQRLLAALGRWGTADAAALGSAIREVV